MRRRVRLLAGIVASVLAGLLVGMAGVPAGATVPEPETPLETWMAEEAAQVVVASETSSLSVEERSRVVIGAPIPVWAWSADFSRGAAAEPLTETDQWVAPLSLDGSGVGVLVVTVGQRVTDHRENWDSTLASALLAVPAASFIYDADLDGWFRLAGEILTPITAKAKDVLAGSLPISDYQPYLTQRTQPSAAPITVQEDAPTGISLPVLITAGAVLILLAAVLASVWVRRPLPEEES